MLATHFWLDEVEANKLQQLHHSSHLEIKIDLELQLVQHSRARIESQTLKCVFPTCLTGTET